MVPLLLNLNVQKQTVFIYPTLLLIRSKLSHKRTKVPCITKFLMQATNRSRWTALFCNSRWPMSSLALVRSSSVSTSSQYGCGTRRQKEKPQLPRLRFLIGRMWSQSRFQPNWIENPRRPSSIDRQLLPSSWCWSPWSIKVTIGKQHSCVSHADFIPKNIYFILVVKQSTYC